MLLDAANFHAGASFRGPSNFLLSSYAQTDTQSVIFGTFMFLVYCMINTTIVAVTPIDSLGELTSKAKEKVGDMHGECTTQPTSSQVSQVLGPHYLALTLNLLLPLLLLADWICGN